MTMASVTRPKLRGEVKQKWVQALRSGEYRQGRTNLHAVTGEMHRFCCLGVLCDLAVRDGVVQVVEAEGWCRYGHRESWRATLPPMEVVDWAFGPGVYDDVDTTNWVVPFDGPSGNGDGTAYLTELNDADQLPFTEIADLIEEGL